MKLKIILFFCVFFVSSFNAFGQPKEEPGKYLGNGFRVYGVAVPYATSRGTVATVNAKGQNVILVWLADHRDTYSLLMINVNKDTSQQFFLPFNGNSYTSLLSSQNRFYTQFNGHFIEFDPSKKAFTFIGKTPSGTAMSMTENDQGIIWAALRPNCRLISYNPKTEKITDYGILYKSESRQDPRSIAVDNKGWVYVTCGSPGNEVLIAFNPKTMHSQLIQDSNINSIGKLSLLTNSKGNVFVKAKGKILLTLHGGEASSINLKDIVIQKQEKKELSFITGNQALFSRLFPDGKRIEDWISAVNPGFLKPRKVTIKDYETGHKKEVTFDYKTEGATITGIVTSPEGFVVGGSMFPMFYFKFNPQNGEWTRYNSYGQYNTFAVWKKYILLVVIQKAN